MKVIYDTSTLGVLYKTGIPTYVLELATALLKRQVSLIPSVHERLYPSVEMPSLLDSARKRFESEVSPGTHYSVGVVNRIKSEVSKIKIIRQYIKDNRIRKSKLLIDQEKPRLQHVLAHAISFSLFDLPLVYTLHDMSVFAHPEAHAELNIRVFKTAMEFLANWMAKGRSLKIITDSSSTRYEVRKFLGEDFYNHSETVMLACDRATFKPADSESQSAEKFILSVGTLEPRKNFTRLLEAFSVIARKQTDLNLYLVGAPGWKNENFRQIISSHPYSHRIRLMGYVGTGNLVKLYQEAEVFCYPSLYEGFGLPVLEAMSCGCPVVVSNSTSLPEVGGEAALCFDPHSTEKLVEAIEKAISNKRVLSDRSLQQAARFSWDKTAESTEKIYRSVSGF
jgi:glycosyltransferase involved in cell wall biosynthesis